MLLSSFKLPFPVFLGPVPVLGQTMFCTVHKTAVIPTSPSVPGENQALKGSCRYYWILLLFIDYNVKGSTGFKREKIRGILSRF